MDNCDNCVTVRHVFIMERPALMIYEFVLCIWVVHCSGALGSLRSPSLELSAVRFLYVRQKLRPPSPPPPENGLGCFLKKNSTSNSIFLCMQVEKCAEI